MSLPYTLLRDMASEIVPPENGTLSHTVHQDESLKAVLFGFGAGQELSEHTASTPAVMHILSGEAEVGVGSDTIAAGPGTWIHMPPNLAHSVRAKTPVVMLLLLLKQRAATA